MKMTESDFRQPRPFIVIFQSELEAVAGVAVSAGAIETGGELYGLFSQARRSVISLAVPAGPAAVHDHAHFRQDIDYINRVSAYLRKKFAIQLLGNHHSHHELGIKGLSGGDIRSTHSIARKNGYQNMCQLLVTFDDFAARYSQYRQREGYLISDNEKWGWGHRNKRNHKAGRASRPDRCPTVHAFYYENAASGQPIRCPIKVIPGISPIRRALTYSNPIQELRGGSHQYPLTKIQFDNLEFRERRQIRDSKISTNENEFLEYIRSQAKLLPEEIKDDIHVKHTPDAAILRMPLDDEHLLILAINPEPDHDILSIMVSQAGSNNDPIDVTEDVMNKSYKASILSIYRASLRLIKDHKNALDSQDRLNHMESSNTPGETTQCKVQGENSDELRIDKQA